MEALDFEENGVKIRIPGNSIHPTKSVPFYNPQMISNRYLVFLTLKSFCDGRKDVIECLDAFSASGIMGLQWRTHLPDRLSLYIAEMNKTACMWIERNFQLNGFSISKVESQSLTDERSGPLSPDVFLLNDDCNVVMQKKSFDFIHLDPFGSTCLHLEPAFRRLRHEGILTLTSTDSASLFARNPQVVRRNYAAEVVKTEYVKEMAVRIIVAAAARAAARCNKGVKVLFAISAEHYFLIALQVLRGPASADRSIGATGRLLHCRVCEERAFLPDQLSPLEEPYRLLPCACHASETGRTAVVLGPMWKDALFCPDFVARLLAAAQQVNQEISPTFRTTLRLLGEEAGAASCSLNSVAATTEDGDEPPRKKERERSTEAPAFYYFPSRMKLSNVDLPKIDHLVRLMRRRGFVCSRTHFETTAIRANCSLSEVRDVIQGQKTEAP